MTAQASEFRRTATQDQAMSPLDEEVTMTYRQITEFRLQAGMEALDNAIDAIKAEMKEPSGNGRVNALTLVQQQRSAYEAHLIIERASTKSCFLASLA